MSDKTNDFRERLLPRLLYFAGTSIVSGNASANGAGATDGETTNGSTSNGAFRSDGKQSIIGYGGQVMLGFGLAFGETAVLAMNAAVGGSYIGGSASGNNRPLIGWQDLKALSTACLADIFVIGSGTNDLSTTLLSTGQIADLVNQEISVAVAIRDTHLQRLDLAGRPKDVHVIVENCPPKTTSANEQLNVIAFNAALRTAIAALNSSRISYFDLFDVVAKPDGTWRAGFSSDQVHPNGREVAIAVAEAIQVQYAYLIDPDRSVFALGNGLDLAEIGALNVSADGAMPDTMTSGGSVAAAGNCFVPPLDFSRNDTGVSGVELRGVTSNGSCWLKKDVSLFASRVAATYVMTAVAEIVQNSPSSGTVTCNLTIRNSWQDSGGTDIGRVSLFGGHEGTFDKVRLSVLFTVPELTGQLTATMAKGTIQAGAVGTAGSSSSTKFNVRMGDLKFIPIDV